RRARLPRAGWGDRGFAARRARLLSHGRCGLGGRRGRRVRRPHVGELQTRERDGGARPAGAARAGCPLLPPRPPSPRFPPPSRHVADAVICGHDRGELGALLFLAPGGDASAIASALATQRGLASSTRIARVLVMTEPPSIDAGEITDKGYINQRAVRERRAADV